MPFDTTDPAYRQSLDRPRRETRELAVKPVAWTDAPETRNARDGLVDLLELLERKGDSEMRSTVLRTVGAPLGMRELIGEGALYNVCPGCDELLDGSAHYVDRPWHGCRASETQMPCPDCTEDRDQPRCEPLCCARCGAHVTAERGVDMSEGEEQDTVACTGGCWLDWLDGEAVS